ncbi:hypothetical protein Tco_0158104 [Tanacetum coccineum]
MDDVMIDDAVVFVEGGGCDGKGDDCSDFRVASYSIAYDSEQEPIEEEPLEEPNEEVLVRRVGEGGRLRSLVRVKTLIMDEAHASRYLVHPRTDKTYYDLRDMHVIIQLFDVLYGRKCKSHVLLAEIGEIRIAVGDKVMLEVSSWKDVVHFGKKEMLAPRYVGPFKYLADTNLHVHLEEIKVDKTLRFVEEPVEIILIVAVTSLKRIWIPIVKTIGTRKLRS